jgi:hypothetical protein
MPSGVTSKAQARIKAMGNPIISTTSTSVGAHSGSRSIGNVVALTSTNSQAMAA